MSGSSSYDSNGLSSKLDLVHRPRRNRRADWARRLVRETSLTVDDLIWPLFVREGTSVVEPIASMPGVSRLSVDEVVKAARVAADAGIPVIALFPYTNPDLRNEQGSEALNGHNLVCQVCRAVKKAVPQIGILTDVALDPYTSHGHDGLLENGVILNDATETRQFHLNRSYQGLLICPMIWRELNNFSSGSVCMVLASHHYTEDDYYRDYDDYVADRGKQQ